MRVLILGGSGMLGHKLLQRLSPEFDVYATVRGTADRLSDLGIAKPDQIIDNIDVLDDAALTSAIIAVKPDAVINAVGVIKQLPGSHDVVNTLLVNSILPHRLFEMGRRHNFRLVTVSTDCVFAGTKGNYSEADPADALDLYGRSKNLGEVIGDRCLTIRSSIIGRELQSSHSLVEWFLENRERTVKGFTKAIYSGFPTIVFADIISDLLQNHPDLQGLYHISSDPIDKYRLLSYVNDAYEAGVDLEPDENIVIDRSLDSSRFRRETGFVPPDWEQMIDRMASDPTPYHELRK